MTPDWLEWVSLDLGLKIMDLPGSINTRAHKVGEVRFFPQPLGSIALSSSLYLPSPPSSAAGLLHLVSEPGLALVS